MAAPDTNRLPYNVLLYGVHPDHLPGGADPWGVFKCSLATHGSYPVHGADDSALDGTYENKMSECTHSNQWGSTTSPNMIAGRLNVRLTWEVTEPWIDDYSHDKLPSLIIIGYNFLVGFEFQVFFVDESDPLPLATGVGANLIFKSTVTPGDVDISLAPEGSVSNLTMRLGDRIEFDREALVLRQRYCTYEAASRWEGKLKPALFGQWNPFENWDWDVDGEDDQTDQWIEAPIVRRAAADPCRLAGAPEECVFADMGARSDDCPDSRRAVVTWADDGGFKKAVDEWRRGTTGGWSKPMSDIWADPSGEIIRDLFHATKPLAAWENSVADRCGRIGKYSAIAMDSNGFLHVSAWCEVREMLIYNTNASGEWKEEVPDPETGRGKWTSIAVDSDDNVHISYQDYVNDPVFKLRYATNSSGSWVVLGIDTTAIGNATSMAYSSIAVGSDDKVHIAYRGTIILRYATNASGAWVAETADPVGTSNSSLALDSDDDAHISYIDIATSNLMYATNATGAWVINFVTLRAGVEPQTSIGLNSDGVVYISFHDLFAGDRLMWVITNITGLWVSSQVEHTVGNDVGKYSSLAIASDNTLRISYYNETTKNLRYASNAGGPWVCEDADDDTDVGAYGMDRSLFLSSLDIPHISYYAYESTTGAYRWLHLIIDTPPDPWEQYHIAYLKQPFGFTVFGTGPDAATAKHPVAIILLLLKDSQIGLGIGTDAAGEHIDADSFTAVTLSLGVTVVARRWIDTSMSVLDVIAEICYEYNLKLIVEAGIYKLIYVNWTTTPPPVTIQAGQIKSFRLRSDVDRMTMGKLQIGYRFNPVENRYFKTYTADSGWDSGAAPTLIRSKWIYEETTVKLIADRIDALRNGVIQDYEMVCDASMLGYQVGDRLGFAGDTTVFQICGYEKDYTTGRCELTLKALNSWSA